MNGKVNDVLRVIIKMMSKIFTNFSDDHLFIVTECMNKACVFLK